MAYRRSELRSRQVLSAKELQTRKDGEIVRTAGCVIARQRPGTAKGFIFLSMEDETGIANVIVTPDLYERDRLVVTRSKFILVEGPLQRMPGNGIPPKTTHRPHHVAAAASSSSSLSEDAPSPSDIRREARLLHGLSPNGQLLGA
jgi:DNA polymerase III alpha subunit